VLALNDHANISETWIGSYAHTQTQHGKNKMIPRPGESVRDYLPKISPTILTTTTTITTLAHQIILHLSLPAKRALLICRRFSRRESTGSRVSIDLATPINAVHSHFRPQTRHDELSIVLSCARAQQFGHLNGKTSALVELRNQFIFTPNFHREFNR
jgi:hypothetical protein